ncbi:MAG: hypothetical protein WBQ50_01970 [Nocardioides sp.]
MGASYVAARDHFSGWSAGDLKASAAGRELLGQDPDLLVSAAVVAVADLTVRQDSELVGEEQLGDEIVGQRAWVGPHLFAAAVVDALRRRRLPWTAEEVTLVLRVVTEGFDQTAITFALGVARAFSSQQPGDPAVYTALQNLRRRLDRQPDHVYQVPELRQRLTALLADQIPSGVPDLSAIDTSDLWGPMARELVREAVTDSSGPGDMVALWSRATKARPSQRWTRTVSARATGSPAVARLIRDLLEFFLTVELSPVVVVHGPPEAPFPGSWLVSPANAVLLRGIVLTSEFVDGDWVAPLLGHVALRSAANHPAPGEPASLCGPAVGAAIDVLGRRRLAGDARAAEQLGLLGREITRRNLQARIAAALA